MEIRVNESGKMVEVWLRRAEREDAIVQEGLKPVYAEYSKKGYLVAVFLSGDQDLYQQTTDLLKFNRRRSAQREVQQKKANRAMM